MATKVETCGATGPAGAAGKPLLAERPLVTAGQAADLVGLFKVLGNDTRLRLLHAMHREGEVSVGELADQLQLRMQAVSNQLQRLSDRRIVTSRRDGSRMLYSIADPCIPALLDLALCLIEETTGRR
jgi:ArsR family transcriptional regulator, lead/cadmium/zinc/bismuth-responsive transcriptional repressor